MQDDSNSVTPRPDRRPRCRRSAVGQGSHLAAIPSSIRLDLATLRRTDNWRNLIYIGYDWIVIALAVTASKAIDDDVWNPVVYGLAVLVIGSRQRGLMNLVHEGSHRKLFRNRKMNDWVGRLFAAFPLLASLEAYVCSHCLHHGFLWDPKKDPKTVRYGQLGLIQVPARIGEFVGRHLVRPAFLTHVPFNIRGTVSWEGEPKSERLARLGFWAIVLPVIVVSGLWPDVLLYWAVPYVTTFQVIRYYGEMAEHAGLKADNPWMATRNWNGSVLSRWLLAPHYDDTYHLVHHLFPAIPHYRLGKAHRLLMRVPEYAAGHHCDGFFLRRRPDAPSVVRDILRPEDIVLYKSVPEKLLPKPFADGHAA